MLSRRRVYLDYSASTPTDPRVLDAMLPYFTTDYGNAASSHALGRKAEHTINAARATIARVLNCNPHEIRFTSGASEANNLSLRGTSWSARHREQGKHLITSPVEHSAVIKTVEQLSTVMGFEHSLLPVDHLGRVHPDDFEKLHRNDTTLVSVMLVNNEVGTIQPIADLAKLAHAHQIPIHTDAVQAAGQLSLDVQSLSVDMLSLSAHKFYGPKGIGILFVRDGIEFDRYDEQVGESINIPFIVGMAKALELAYAELPDRVKYFTGLRDQLIEGVLRCIPDVILTGHPTHRLPSHASFLFDGLDGNSLVTHLDMRGVATSSASACKTGNPEPSSVLLAMGYTPKEALGSLRLTVGLQTSPEDIDYTVDVLSEVVMKLRKLNREMAL